MRFFFVSSDALEADPVTIGGGEARHIRNVLRLKTGDEIGLLDGSGAAWRAEILRLEAAAVSARLLERLPDLPEPPVRLAVAQGWLKESKMDELVRRLCELGVAEWRPFFAERSVARPPEKRLAARLERWRGIAREAVKQCGRRDLPQIDWYPTFEDVLAAGRRFSRRILFWERAGGALEWSTAPVAEPGGRGVLLVLGPEGGFTDAEADRALRHGFEPAGLGPRVLRAETAAVAACAIVQYVYGDMGPKKD